MPISGVIIKANLDLELNSTILNKSHYDKGWIIIIKPSNLKQELQNLFKVNNLRPWLKKEMVNAEKRKFDSLS